MNKVRNNKSVKSFYLIAASSNGDNLVYNGYVELMQDKQSELYDCFTLHISIYNIEKN